MVLRNVSPTASSDAAAESALYDLVDDYDRAYEAAAKEWSLSAAQACLLSRLDHPQSMGRLAEDLSCDASNVTQIGARLESLGLITRTPSPDDRRVRLLARTSEGDEIVKRFEETFTFARQALNRLTPAERVRLTTLLRKALGCPTAEGGGGAFTSQDHAEYDASWTVR